MSSHMGFFGMITVNECMLIVIRPHFINVLYLSCARGLWGGWGGTRTVQEAPTSWKEMNNLQKLFSPKSKISVF